MQKKKKMIVSSDIITLTKGLVILCSLMLRLPINKVILSLLINLNSLTTSKSHSIPPLGDWTHTCQCYELELKNNAYLKSAPCSLKCCPKSQLFYLRSCEGLVSLKLSKSEYFFLFNCLQICCQDFLWWLSCLQNCSIQVYRVPPLKIY